MEGVVVDKILFRFARYRSVPEILAIEVESCQKSRRILDVFSLSEILGGKHHEHFISPPVTPYGRPDNVNYIVVCNEYLPFSKPISVYFHAL